MAYNKNDRVEHVQTGAEGTVVKQDSEGVEVNWDANEHGGYLGTHSSDEVTPLR
jgi:hypothetical protein